MFEVAARTSLTQACRNPEMLEFQLDATFADNFGHICIQIVYLYMLTILKKKSSCNFMIKHSGVFAFLDFEVAVRTSLIMGGCFNLLKTLLLVQAVANQTSATFLRVVGSELIQK